MEPKCWCGHVSILHFMGTGACTAKPLSAPSCMCTAFKTIQQLETPPSPIGYHIAWIPQGEYGEVSKIEEELAEFKDALAQRCSLMALLELADLIGAIEGYLDRHHPSIELSDLLSMAAITKRAFKVGHRVPKEE